MWKKERKGRLFEWIWLVTAIGSPVTILAGYEPPPATAATSGDQLIPAIIPLVLIISAFAYIIFRRKRRLSTQEKSEATKIGHMANITDSSDTQRIFVSYRRDDAPDVTGHISFPFTVSISLSTSDLIDMAI